MSDLATAEARVPTAVAARYLGQLCKHFGHKVPAQHDERAGRIEFPFGTAILRAEPDALLIRLESADAEGLARIEGVVASHLERFAFREALAVDWQRPAAA